MSNPVITELTDLMNTGGIPHYIFNVLAQAAAEINRLEEARRVAEAGERSADQEVERLQKVVKGLHGDLESVVGLRDLVDDIKATLILKNDDEIIPDLDRMIEKERLDPDISNIRKGRRDEIVDHYQLARERLDELYVILRVGSQEQARVTLPRMAKHAKQFQEIAANLDCDLDDVIEKVKDLFERNKQLGDVEGKYKTLFDEYQGLRSEVAFLENKVERFERTIAEEGIGDQNSAAKTLLRIQQILGMAGSTADELVSLIVKLQSRSDLTEMLHDIYSVDHDQGYVELEMTSDGGGIVKRGNGATLFVFNNEDELWEKYEQYVGS